MHDSHDTRASYTATASTARPLPDPSLADAFYAAVEELGRAVKQAGSSFFVEHEAFAQGASTVKAELDALGFEAGDEQQRLDRERRVVELLDRITTVALQASPRHRELHRAAFEVAVRASQLAFVLRDMSAPITWH